MCAEIVISGDKLPNLTESEKSGKVVLGPGLRRDKDDVYATRSGIIRHKEPNVYWIDSHQKRYVPVRGDNVLGIIVGKAGDIFKVDVGGSEHASLSYLAFEGATKRNRPDVKIGDIVFAKFLVANKDMETELVCIDGHGRSSGLGVIREGGYLITCSISLVRKILSKDCILLKTLGNSLPYEIAVGLNGRIWIKGRSTKETIAVMNAISNAEYLNNTEIKTMVRRIMDSLAGF